MTNLSDSQRWAYDKSGQIENRYYACVLRNITAAELSSLWPAKPKT